MSAVVTPIDRYLAEQRDATAVERFARRHDADLLVPGERWYADRLPTASPGPGEQYAFRVDLDLCTGCKSCVAACHSLNGLDDGESWRSVGQLVGRDADHPRQQHVPTGCHHCLDPACLAGCPTNAYEKDPFSGIVRHLDDQCIGCSYCELTCPYEVPTLNRRLGIVRKCDLCADRLADGEAPACVQACPTSAITITVVDNQQVRAETRSGAVVPGAPASALTGPTTQYVGAPDVLDHPGSFDGADDHAVRPSRGHPPLAVMLVLTQLSVGAMLATVLADFTTGAPPAGAAAGAALAGVMALGASVLHLGRPAMAWRAVLGVGHSWLSREIVAFGVYAAASTAYAGASVIDAPVTGALAGAAALSGVVAVGCSALVYIVTGRASWRARATVWRFTASSASTGPLLFSSILLWASAGEPVDQRVGELILCAVAVTAVSTTAKLCVEALALRTTRFPAGSERDRTARLLTGPLALQSQWRFALGGLGGIAGPAVVAFVVASTTHPSAVAAAAVATLALAGTAAGELVERHQFFTASVAPRMPGGFRR